MKETRILANNIKRALEAGRIRDIDHVTGLAKKAGISKPTLTQLIKTPDDRNPGMGVLSDVATALRVPAWTLLVPDFPFDDYQYNEKPPEKMHRLTHCAFRTMESNNDLVKLLIIEGISHSLCKIDEKKSHQVKEYQANYINNQK